MHLLSDIQSILISEHGELSLDRLMTSLYSKGDRYNLLETHEQNLDKETVIDLIDKYGNIYGLRLSEDKTTCYWKVIARRSASLLYIELAKELKVYRWYTPELNFLILAYNYFTEKRDPDNFYVQLNLKSFRELKESTEPVKLWSLELARLENAVGLHGVFNGLINDWLLDEKQEIKTAYSKLLKTAGLTPFSLSYRTIEQFGYPKDDRVFVLELLDAYNNDQKFKNGVGIFLPVFIRELILGLSSSWSNVAGYNCPGGLPLLLMKPSQSTKTMQSSQLSLCIDLLSSVCVGKRSTFIHEDFSRIGASSSDESHVIFPELRDKSYDVDFKIPDFDESITSLKSVPYSILRTLKLMNSKSRAIVLVPDGFLFNSSKSFKSVREYLVNQNILEAVISLPKNIYRPHHGVRMSLLVLNKAKPAHLKDLFLFSETDILYHILWDKAQVPQFAEDVVQQIIADLESGKLNYPDGNYNTFADAQMIAEYDFNLRVGNFFANEASGLKYLSGTTVLLSDVARKVSNRYKPTSNDYPLLHISDLQSNLLSPYLNIDDSMRLRYEPGKINYNLIEQNALIVSLISSNPKPTLFEYKGQPLLITNNIMALIVDSAKIDPEYLRHCLSEEYVKVQIDYRLSGTTIPRITEEEFLSISIRIEDSLEKQKALVQDYKKKVVRDEKSKIERLESLNKISNSEVQVLSAIKHAYKQLGIESLVFVLEKAIERSVVSKTCLDWNAPVIDNSTDSLRTHFNKLNASVKNAAQIFESIQSIMDADRSQMKRTEYNACTLIHSILKDLPDSSYFKFACDETLSIEAWLKDQSQDFEKPIIYVDRIQFVEVFKNLLRNALVHGYSSNNTDIKFFYVNCSRYDDKTVIKIYNNGDSFPENFSFDDFVTWRRKGENSTGSGVGGYIINKVIKNHEGDFRIVNEPSSFDVFVSPAETFMLTSNFHFEIELPCKPPSYAI